MSSLTLLVEPMAGTSINDAIEDAKELCIKTGVAYVSFKFNGCDVHVGKECNIVHAIDEWNKKGKHTAKYGYVFG